MRIGALKQSRRGLELSVTALGVLTLSITLLFRILIKEILRHGRGLLSKLLPIGLQAVWTGQL